MIQPDIKLHIIGLAALVPIFIAKLLYSSAFGKQWMYSLGYKDDILPKLVKSKSAIFISFGLSFCLSYFIAIILEYTHRFINVDGELGFNSFHKFRHGAYHGFMISIALLLPITINNLLFSEKKFRVIVPNLFFWLLCITLMSAIIDDFS